MSDKPLYGKDGLLARKGGEYARAKLDFLDAFVPPALMATRTKIDRVFLDLFAGPGVNVVPGTGEEFPGSPLRVTTLTAPARPEVAFTRGIFCNIDAADNAALQARLASACADGSCTVKRLECELTDTNAALPRILSTIHARAYIFAFADIEGIEQLPWATIEALRARHTSVDLYVLMPLEMSLNRLLGTDPAHRAKHADVLTRYFGHEEWKPIADTWVTDAQGARVRRELLELYISGLRKRWEHADVVEVARTGDRLYYRMIFASQHPAGKRLAKWASARPHDGELRLALD